MSTLKPVVPVACVANKVAPLKLFEVLMYILVVFVAKVVVQTFLILIFATPNLKVFAGIKIESNKVFVVVPVTAELSTTLVIPIFGAPPKTEAKLTHSVL